MADAAPPSRRDRRVSLAVEAVAPCLAEPKGCALCLCLFLPRFLGLAWLLVPCSCGGMAVRGLFLGVTSCASEAALGRSAAATGASVITTSAIATSGVESRPGALASLVSGGCITTSAKSAAEVPEGPSRCADSLALQDDAHSDLDLPLSLTLTLTLSDDFDLGLSGGLSLKCSCGSRFPRVRGMVSVESQREEVEVKDAKRREIERYVQRKGRENCELRK